MNFVRVELANGSEAFINTAHVVALETRDDGKWVVSLAGGHPNLELSSSEGERLLKEAFVVE